MIKRAVLISFSLLLSLGVYAASSMETRLGDAVHDNNIEAVRQLIKEGVNVNAPQDAEGNGITPLMMAASNGYTDIVKLLLVAGADKDAKIRTNGQTALSLARLMGHQDVADILLNSGAENNSMLIQYAASDLKKAAQYLEAKEYDAALEIYQKAANVFLKEKDYEDYVAALTDIANAYRLKEDYGKAIENILQAISANEKYTKNGGGASAGFQPGDFNVDEFRKNYKDRYKLLAETFKKNGIDTSDLSTVTDERLANASNELLTMSNLPRLIDENKSRYDADYETVDDRQKAEFKAKIAGIYPPNSLKTSNNKKFFSGMLCDIAGSLYELDKNEEKAMEYYKNALAAFKEIDKKDQIENAYAHLGGAYLNLKRYGEAENCFEQALSVYAVYPAPSARENILLPIAQGYFKMGLYDKALDCLKKCNDAPKTAGADNGTNSLISCYTGNVYFLKGDYSEAVKYYNEAVKASELILAASKGPEETGDAIEKYYYCWEAYIDASIKAGNYYGAFDVNDSIRSMLLVDSINGKMNKKSGNYAPAKQLQGKLNSDTLVVAFTNFSLVSGTYRLALGNKDIAGAELKYETFINDIFVKYPDIAELLRKKNVKAQDDHIYDERLKYKLNGYNLYHLINYYDGLLGNPALTREEKEKRDYIAKGLYNIFFGGLEAALQGKKDLVIIPSGIMSKLPFETLITPDNRYMAEQYNFKYEQSLNVMNLLDERKYKAGRKPLLALGGAVYNRQSYDTDMKASRTQLASMNLRSVKAEETDEYRVVNFGVIMGKGWENLPSTLTEVQAIGKIVKGSDIYTGPDANKPFIKQISASGKLKDYKVLHFATHGFMLGIKNGASLVLSVDNHDSAAYLWSMDIEKLNINADFVNLSACETATGKLTMSGGQEGLNQAFFTAGANSVCSSLWPVADQSTMKFMVGLYKLVDEKKMSYDQAMTEMKRQFISGALDREEDAGEPTRGLKVTSTGAAAPVGKYSDPYYWAPFVYKGK